MEGGGERLGLRDVFFSVRQDGHTALPDITAAGKAKSVRQT